MVLITLRGLKFGYYYLSGDKTTYTRYLDYSYYLQSF